MTRLASRPAQHPAAAPKDNNVITIASGKGGVGKTFLSITLAHAMARQGRRTILFDGDLGLANVDIQLGLDAPQDLAHVAAGRAAIDDVICRFEAGNFDIAAGKSGSGMLANLQGQPLQRLRAGLLHLAGRYDTVIVDLGAGVEPSVRALTPQAGTTLVVINDEPTSLTDAYAFIKLYHADTPGRHLGIIVNMAHDRSAGERTYGKLLKVCQTFLGLSPPLAGVIRRDMKIPDAIRHQTALLIRHPTSQAAADVEQLAQRLSGGEQA